MLGSLLTILGLNRAAAVIVGALVISVVVAGATIYIMNLRVTARAYEVLSIEHAALEKRYGCPSRPDAAERGLGTCLTARDRDIEKARSDRLAELQRQAAESRERLAAANQQLESASVTINALIEQSAHAGGDGPVPGVLRDLFARQRQERGATP